MTIPRVSVIPCYSGFVRERYLTGTGDRTWDHFCDVLVMIRCPGDLGVGICTWLCVYAFRDVWIVVYDMGGCHMDVVIDCGEVN